MQDLARPCQGLPLRRDSFDVALQSFYRALLRPFLTLEQFRSLDEVLSSSVALVQDASNPQGRGENWLKFGLQIGI